MNEILYSKSKEEIETKRNSVAYPAPVGIKLSYGSGFKKRTNYKELAKDQCEKAIQRSLLKYRVFEIEGSREVTSNEDFYEIKIKVDKNENKTGETK